MRLTELHVARLNKHCGLIRLFSLFVLLIRLAPNLSHGIYLAAILPTLGHHRIQLWRQHMIIIQCFDLLQLSRFTFACLRGDLIVDLEFHDLLLRCLVDRLSSG